MFKVNTNAKVKSGLAEINKTLTAMTKAKRLLGIGKTGRSKPEGQKGFGYLPSLGYLAFLSESEPKLMGFGYLP